MKPKAITTVLEALHPDSNINRRAVQNASAAQTGAERALDATDAFEQVCTIAGNGRYYFQRAVVLLTMLATSGRLVTEVMDLNFVGMIQGGVGCASTSFRSAKRERPKPPESTHVPLDRLNPQIKQATADGGICEVKMDDQRRLTHIWWQTRKQVIDAAVMLKGMLAISFNHMSYSSVVFV